ncbi:MAG: ketopantoate reductase family protein [Clostridia bacterium]
MRFVVLGAGAIGGVVGGRLIQHGYEAAFIARGAHGRQIARGGLRLESAEGVSLLHPSRVAEGPEDVDWRSDDVVLLAVKSQDTMAAVSRLAASAPRSLALVCLQNGVANEKAALRWFPSVYGAVVMCPAGHLEPGTVVAYASPLTALIAIGRYPAGTDDTAAAIAAAVSTSAMDARVRPDIMRWKYGKLVLMNLANAIDALCGYEARGGRLSALVREEGIQVLRAAGIAFASEEEDRERRGTLLQSRAVEGQPRGGSSSWQSLARASGSIETDFLNGEIVLLGRLHGIPTPANALLQRAARDAAVHKRVPGSVSEQQLLDQIR